MDQGRFKDEHRKVGKDQPEDEYGTKEEELAKSEAKRLQQTAILGIMRGDTRTDISEHRVAHFTEKEALTKAEAERLQKMAILGISRGDTRTDISEHQMAQLKDEYTE